MLVSGFLLNTQLNITVTARLSNAQLPSLAAILLFVTGDTEVRWLSAEEQRIWRSFVVGVQTLLSTVEGQLQRESAIPFGYYEILVRLSEAPDRSMRMSQLAEASTSSKSRSVFVIDAEGVLRWKHVTLVGLTFPSAEVISAQLAPLAAAG